MTSQHQSVAQVEREDSLIHLMRVNLLKRLESSIHSFRLTLTSLLNQVEYLSDKIKVHTSKRYFFDFDITEIGTR
jgi:hypothetical protein